MVLGTFNCNHEQPLFYVTYNSLVKGHFTQFIFDMGFFMCFVSRPSVNKGKLASTSRNCNFHCRTLWNYLNATDAEVAKRMPHQNSDWAKNPRATDWIIHIKIHGPFFLERRFKKSFAHVCVRVCEVSWFLRVTLLCGFREIFIFVHIYVYNFKIKSENQMSQCYSTYHGARIRIMIDNTVSVTVSI